MYYHNSSDASLTQLYVWPWNLLCITDKYLLHKEKEGKTETGRDTETRQIIHKLYVSFFFFKDLLFTWGSTSGFGWGEEGHMCPLTCVRHDFPPLGGCYGNSPTSRRNAPSLKWFGADRVHRWKTHIGYTTQRRILLPRRRRFSPAELKHMEGEGKKESSVKARVHRSAQDSGFITLLFTQSQFPKAAGFLTKYFTPNVSDLTDRYVAQFTKSFLSRFL